MAVYKCKMCGGQLEIAEGATVVRCDFCETEQTVPTADSEKKISMMAKANELRMKNEFDKASVMFENAAAEFPAESEAYWGICLCKYGIEYVDDPSTGKKIPTCHRTSFESIFDDGNYAKAVDSADSVTAGVYRSEAKEIERLRQAILDIANKEQPFDIFICYKETDENGGRTVDSVRAQQIYDELTKQGYKVFFSRITLEDKLGQEYEPYIFSALNSAKIMLVMGTKPEYFEAVWVRNEWSRFLEMMKTDREKKLFPCYEGIDPYDMPKEFRNLQAQDTNQVGFEQDLIRNISKIIPKGTAAQGNVQVIREVSGPSAENLIKRGGMALEDRMWDDANNYFDQALNIDAESARAYFGLFMAETQLRTTDEINNIHEDILANSNVQKACRYADPQYKKELDGYILLSRYNACVFAYRQMCESRDYEGLLKISKQFETFGDFRKSRDFVGKCRSSADEITDMLVNYANEMLAEGSFTKAYKMLEYYNANRTPTVKSYVGLIRAENCLKSEVEIFTLPDLEKSEFFIKAEQIADTDREYFDAIVKKMNEEKERCASVLAVRDRAAEAYKVQGQKYIDLQKKRDMIDSPEGRTQRVKNVVIAAGVFTIINVIASLIGGDIDGFGDFFGTIIGSLIGNLIWIALVYNFVWLKLKAKFLEARIEAMKVKCRMSNETFCAKCGKRYGRNDNNCGGCGSHYTFTSEQAFEQSADVERTIRSMVV